MSLGGFALGEFVLGGVGYAQAGTAPEIPPDVIDVSSDPYTVEIDGISIKPLSDSLSIENELGRQGSANFTLINVQNVPQVGQQVRVFWYDYLIFAGMVDRVKVESNNMQTYRTFECECVDYSYLLFRYKMRRTFTNVQWIHMLFTVMDEIAADGITLGSIDVSAWTSKLASVDVKDGNAHDLLSEAAAAIGAIFYIDYEKKANFVTVQQMPSSPETLDGTIVERALMSEDRETYRNKQTITVTGTPPNQSTEPVTITYVRANAEQIAYRQQIEGGTGIYPDFESITHPTSNSPTALNQLGVSYALLRLGVQGALRRNLSIRTRAFGFKAGQLATVNLPQLGIEGDGTGEQWIIQKSRITETAGKFIITSLELTSSSLLRRAQELWLDIVKKGQITVIPNAPTTVVTTTVTITTTGTTAWVVPAGVFQIQASCYGAGGGGGGGAKSSGPPHTVNGGNGGNGGLAVSVLDVTPGETLTMVIGTGGSKGTTVSQSLSPVGGTPGQKGTVDTVIKRGSLVLMGATPGLAGQAGTIGIVGDNTYTVNVVAGYNGGTGGGYGQINTYGGGSAGGAKGTGSPLAQPTAGANGKITVEY